MVEMKASVIYFLPAINSCNLKFTHNDFFNSLGFLPKTQSFSMCHCTNTFTGGIRDMEATFALSTTLGDMGELLLFN